MSKLQIRRLAAILVGMAFSLFFLSGSSLVGLAASGGLLQGEDDLKIGIHSETGKAMFIGTDPSRPLTLQASPGQALSSAEIGSTYLAHFGDLLGLKDATQETSFVRGSDANDGGRSERYQQIYQGIPVMAGELIVNLDSQGRLRSISGEISPDLVLDTAPQIAESQASTSALSAIAKAHGVPESSLFATQPQLWVFDERLLKSSERPAELVWRLEVQATNGAPINELVLINAETGGVSLNFNQIDTSFAARSSGVPNNREGLGGAPFSVNPRPLFAGGGVRSTYTANNGTSLPGSFLCNQTTNPCTAGSDPHADAAHAYAADTYDFYDDYHGRNSIDDAGMTMVSTVHYSSGFFNAFWSSSLQQMVYGDALGYPLADDVVGHELTHGVTDNESDLFYYYQSGAINESFSDIWGEFVDQTNGAGTDTAAVKWKMGEDVSGSGAIRDMEDPPFFGDPDRMKSANYHLGNLDGRGFDNGGVHYNSGVGNKAAYLITDGGSFNTYTVTGLGITKAAAIYYEVQTNLLTSGADYKDLYFALDQACQTLIGGAEGITSGNCQEVVDATDATQMKKQPTSGFNPHATVCSAGFVANDLFFDDLESGGGNWVTGVETGSNAWFIGNFYATSGTDSLWGDDSFSLSDSHVSMVSNTTLPASPTAYLHFNHAFGFEDPNYDGGFLEYSTNSGATWDDARPFFNEGVDYPGRIRDPGDVPGANPNRGHRAFIRDSHGYVSSRYDLSSLAGGNVRFRWRLSTDAFVFDLGWFVDDVRIYTCVVPVPSSPPDNVLASDGTFGNRVQVSWDAVADATFYEVYRDTDPGGGSKSLQASPTATSYSDTSVADLTTYYYWVKACSSSGCSGLSASDSGFADASASTEIFSDGFESGDTSAWSGVNFGGGDLTVCPGGAMNGTSQGLCVSVTTKKRKQVWDDTVTDATRYRGRFYFDPNGLSMGNNEKIRIAQTRTGSDLIRPFSVQLRKFSGQYQIRARAQSDLFIYSDTAWYTITDDAHVIEVDWQASSAPGANDGTLTLYLDGVLKQTLTGLDSDTEVVNTLKMGFTSRLGDKNISGTFYMDEFVSDSDAYIGP